MASKQIKRLEGLIANAEKRVATTSKKRRNRRRRRSTTAMFETLGATARVPIAGTGIVKRLLPPRVRNNGTGTVICNSEFAFQVAPATFVSDRLQFIPAQLAWLNGVASSYSKFRWLRLRIIYLPSCPTTVGGNVTLGLGYDEIDDTPTTFPQATASYHSITTTPWGGYEGAMLLNDDTFQRPPAGAVCVDVDVGRFDKLAYPYVTAANLPTGVDANQYVPGHVDVTVSSAVSTSNLGMVYFKYEIELLEPISNLLNE
jgi:hypothetical protein